MTDSVTFHVILVRPTRYGPDGYPLRWHRGIIPSSTLSCLYALVDDCRNRKVLGDDVNIVLHLFDESVQKVSPQRLRKQIDQEGGSALVMMAGVQSNQFPRAFDLSKAFLKNGFQVNMGGFHVSGCMAMFDEPTSELQEAINSGISLFAGEAEGGRLDQVLRDAYAGNMKSIYNHIGEMPEIAGAPAPFLPKEHKEYWSLSTWPFDLGRGCPFDCSFCTIINVHGRKSRCRTAEDLEKIIRKHRSPELHFFITDDNFARNRNWSELLDMVIKLREEEGMQFRMVIQVDTLSHKVPGFIEKCCRSGVDSILIGMETLNQVNLAEVNKYQNVVEDYRECMLAWKQYPVVITVGYIIGFQNDTRESVLADIARIKRELPVDVLSLNLLTPLPGSLDHKRLVEEGAWLDPDLSKYALCDYVKEHPTMSPKEWEKVYTEAFDLFYTDDHIETIFKRMVAMGSNKKLTTLKFILVSRESYKKLGISYYECGLFRMKSRNERSRKFKREGVFTFYLNYFSELVTTFVNFKMAEMRMKSRLMRIWKDPVSKQYTDEAISVSVKTEQA